MTLSSIWLSSIRMHKLAIPFVFLVILLCIADTSSLYAQTPVGWWRFDDGSGNSAIDSSGNGHAAALVNGVTWVSGQTGGAISADGSNQYASIPPIDLSTTHAITWTAWINRTYSTSGGHALLEDSADFNSSTTGFGLFPDGDAGFSCDGIVAGVHGDAGYSVNCYAQPSSGAWHHFAVIFDKTQPGTQVVSLYLDGVLQTPTHQSYTFTNTNAFGNNPLYLFSRAGRLGYCAAKLDDVRLFNQTLTAPQIQQIYAQGTASLVSLGVTPTSASIAAGTTVQYTATGTFSDTTTQNLTGTVNWSSSATNVATISSTGLAKSLASGNTTVTATSGTITGTASLTISAPALVSVVVTPANGVLPVGSNEQFTAMGTYSNGTIQDLTQSVTWYSSTPGVATIGAGGFATSVAAGNTTIQATLGAVVASTTLTVSAPLASISVTPSNSTLAANASKQFTATGTLADGSTQDLSRTVTWTSSSPDIARISSAGLVTGVAAGSTIIQAIMGSISGSSGLTVSAVSLQSIQLTPAVAEVAATATLQLKATGHYNDGTAQDVTTSVTWSIVDPTIATVTSGGVVTGLASGSTTVNATLGSISNSLALVVTPSGLVGRWAFDDGSGTTAVDSSGHGYNATLYNGISWVTGKIGDAVSSNGSSQYILAPSIDLSSAQAVTVTAWINKTWSGAAVEDLLEFSSNFNSVNTGFGLFPNDSGDCGVTSAILSGVHGSAGYALNCYTPPSSGAWHHLAMVYDKSQGASKQASLYIDAVLQTPIASPYSANNTDKFGNNPLYLFARGGAQAFSAAKMDDLRVYSRALSTAEISQIYSLAAAPGNPVLQTITITPASVVLSPGGTQQFVATGHYSDDTTKDLSKSVTWTSTNSTVATINSSGLATAAAAGSTSIQATSGAIIGSSGLTVSVATLQSIQLAPPGAEVATTATVQLTATGTYNDGTTQDVTTSVTWSIANPTIAAVTGGGLVTGLASGGTTVTATLGSISNLLALVVTPSGLVGRWAFDDGSGTTAIDSSGHGYNATLYNGISWVTGQVGDAVSANGSNQYILTPTIDLSSAQAVTVAAWVNKTWSGSAVQDLI
jgi:hypothetical protein